jgi:hypothetical protein
MKRTLLAALLAAPLLLAFPTTAHSNPPKQCFGPIGGCMGLFSKLHQHGPLFNYGPYYGYPPFEPYGAWNAYLHYNPGYYGYGGGHGHGHGHGYVYRNGRGGICGSGGGHHGFWSHGGWFNGHGGLSGGHGCGWFKGHGGKCDGCGASGHGLGGCHGCKAEIGTPAAVGEYYYSGLPTIDPAIAPAGGFAR